jgi:hypothetical protein
VQLDTVLASQTPLAIGRMLKSHRKKGKYGRHDFHCIDEKADNISSTTRNVSEKVKNAPIIRRRDSLINRSTTCPHHD